MKFALSTSWNSQRHGNGRAIVEEIKALGFDEIELNFALSRDMVEEILRAQNQGLINVIGLHNFCPVPEGLPRSKASPDHYSLSSLDEDERARAILETKRTIDTAKEFGAKYVVLHTGKVEITQNSRTLTKLSLEGTKNTRYYQAVARALVEERESMKDRFLKATIRSLEDLSDYSLKAELLLGIENRYYLHEIPSLDEMGIILDHFKATNIFYWHDTGHARVLENLGICKHKDYLDRFGARMIGVHLHDVVGADDHRAPGRGDLNFGILTPYLKEDTFLVLEPHYPATGRQIRRAVKLLRRQLFDGN